MADPISTADRPPPHSFEAEQQLLGCVMITPRAYEDVADFLRPEHFADPTHGRIFEACATLINGGRKADPLALKAIFERDGALAEIGGWAYLSELPGAVVSIVNARTYGEIILDMSRRRDLIAWARELENAAYDVTAEVTADQIQERHEATLFESTSTTDRGGFVAFADACRSQINEWERAHRHRGEVTGVATGLEDLDRRLGGLHPSDLIILGARPAMGKTAFAVNVGYRAARSGLHVGIFELEMQASQLAGRVISAHAGVNGEKARLGELSDKEFEAMVVAGNELRALPLHVDPTPALTIQAIRTRARRLARRHTLGLVIVDHIGLAQPAQRRASKVHEIEEITNGLKALAKDLNVPVLALCQLSRSCETRDDKRPQLSDLRDSGSIEQDADVVMFLYRDQYYLERAEPKPRADEVEGKYLDRLGRWQRQVDDSKNVAEVIIAKNRHGRAGAVRLHFDGDTQRFGNLCREDNYGPY